MHPAPPAATEGAFAGMESSSIIGFVTEVVKLRVAHGTVSLYLTNFCGSNCWN